MKRRKDPPPEVRMRYAVLDPSTNKTHYVYRPSAEEAIAFVDRHLKGSAAVLTATPAGNWDPSSGTIANDPEPYVVFEGSVVARAPKT